MLSLQEFTYNIKCIVQYDGANYLGFQIQNEGITIEACIKESLDIIYKDDIKIYASGRTDKGVHAKGQVFNYFTNLYIEPKRLKYAINRGLPQDIKIISLEYVDLNFHSRFSAKSKEYRYYIKYKDYSVFESRYKAYIENLNINLINEAIKLYLGTHDFTSFCSADIDKRKSCIKTITKAQINIKDDEYEFIFEGDGFLKYQIRRMMGILIAIGKGKIDKDIINELYINHTHQMHYPVAPGCGLYLYKVNY